MRPVQGGSILEVSNIGTCNGQRVMNVWHYRWDGAPTPVADGDLIVGALQDTLQPGGPAGMLPLLKAMCNEIMRWDYVKYQWISPIRYSPVNLELGMGVGQVVTEPLPQNVAGVVTLQSIFGGAGSTGRKHFGGLSAEDEAAGLMTDTFKNHAVELMNLMGAEVNTFGVQPTSKLVPVIYDKATPANSIPWISYTVQETSRVMRRRTVRVGI